MIHGRNGFSSRKESRRFPYRNRTLTCKHRKMCYNYNMRKFITISIICLLFIVTSASYSWSRGWYYGGCGGCNNGWAVGAAIAGGMLVGAVATNMIAQSAVYNPPPQRVYVYPQPNVVYVYPQPSNVAYAYPDPEFTARYSQSKPSGDWVVVPGQTVNGKWVPEHKVLVPAQP